MTLISKTLRIAAVGLALQVSPALAQDSDSQNTAAIGHHGGFAPRQAIRNWDGQRFSVQRLEYLDDDDIRRDQIADWVRSNPDQVDAIQRSIQENHSLSAALRAQNVQIRNVIAVQRALNGSLVFFLR